MTDTYTTDEVERNKVFETQLEAMVGMMNSFNIEWLCGESPEDVIAAEWIENGFEAKYNETDEKLRFSVKWRSGVEYVLPQYFVRMERTLS